MRQNPMKPLTPASFTAADPAPLDFTDRLVPLCDGRQGLRSGLQVQASTPAKPSDTNPAVIDFLVSNQALDRYDEIILPDGWRLNNYHRNPVFQNAHQYSDVIFTLGKALLTEVRVIDGKSDLFQRVEFAVEVNPLARIAYGLYKGKFLNAVSVGFIPLRWENGGPDAGYRRKYLEQELLEVSAVGIPANPEALQLGLKAGGIQKRDLQDLLDLFHGFTDASSSRPPSEASQHNDSAPMILPESHQNSFAPMILQHQAAMNTVSGAPGVHRNGAQLLQLARALRDLLRRS
jgi:HK97 family phage prohead protease